MAVIESYEAVFRADPLKHGLLAYFGRPACMSGSCGG